MMVTPMDTSHLYVADSSLPENMQWAFMRAVRTAAVKGVAGDRRAAHKLGCQQTLHVGTNGLGTATTPERPSTVCCSVCVDNAFNHVLQVALKTTFEQHLM